MKYPPILIMLFLTALFSCTQEQPEVRSEIILTKEAYPGLELLVFEAKNRTALPSRVVIRNQHDSVIKTYYNNLPGIYTDNNGHLKIELEQGNYNISVYHGIDFLSETFPIEINQLQGVKAEVYLKEWIPLKKLGWINGGGHCHLYTEKENDTALLHKVKRICTAQGVDFLCAAQGWAGYNDSTWEAGYSDFSDQRFLLSYGSEMPKYRTGHTWWIGQKSTRDFFWQTMDENYEKRYFQADTGTHWNFDDLTFLYIPSTEVVQRFKKADQAVAIMAHPTSWWWQERGSISKYTTNVVSYLSFGLLAGKIWDGFVVMGYNHDHYFYQNLWFHILNEGYRIPAISELDQGPNPSDRFYYGSMRTYYKVDDQFSIDAAAEAVRRGCTFVTSGPVILANIDNTYGYGEVIQSNRGKRTLNINAYASGESDDYLSYLIIYRNGEVFKLWDLREQKLRSLQKKVTISEEEDAWYVLKAYGRKSWESTDYLDIMKLCDKDFNENIPPNHGSLMDVCITSPFYFRKGEMADPPHLISDIELTLIDKKGAPINNAEIEILLHGEAINKVTYKGEATNFNMPAGATLKISNNGSVIYRNLYLDYTPHRDLLENLASGKWLDNISAKRTFVPGEVPWEAFKFDETKRILKNVFWEITFQENERDPLWVDFENRFKDI